MPQQIKILENKVRYDGYVRVESFKLQFDLYNNGGLGPVVEREVCLRGEAVGILPYDPVLDQVLLIEQFRLPGYCNNVGPWILELPAGIVEDGEKLPEVAEREMQEETGLAVRDLRLLHTYLPSPGILAETIYLYLGRVDLSGVAKEPDKIHGLAEEGENIRLKPTPVSELAGLLERDLVKNATAMLGLYWMLQHHHTLRKEWIS